VRIAINGFGRIGRAVTKILIDNGLNIVAVNDIHGVKDAQYLLQHDSVYGMYDKEVKIEGENLLVDGKEIKVLKEKNPLKLPWKKMGVDIVIESTGVFTDKKGAGQHIKSGAKYVLVTAPCDDCDVTIVPGVNSEKLNFKKHKIISIASCTTNCVSPLAMILNKEFGIKRAMMTTVHAYTNDQAVEDESHKKARRGRAAGLNIIPTTTGATEAVEKVLPELRGKLAGLAVRVPVAVGSLVDLVVEAKKKVSVKKINNVLKKASVGKLTGIMLYSEDELVSSDIIGNSHSCIVDGLSTQVDGNLVKVLGWYDNEFGYSCRVSDVVGMVESENKGK